MKRFFPLLVIFFLSCQPSVIDIAVISDNPKYFEKYKRGAELAVDSINSEGGAGGHNLKLSFYGPQIFEEKLEKLAAVLLCPCSLETAEKAIKFSEGNSIPLFCLFPCFKKGKNSILLGGEILSEVSFLADSIKYSLHADNALVLEFDETISNCFKERFQKIGGKTKILKCKEFSPDELNDKIIDIVSQKETPQVIFIAGTEKENIEPFHNFFESFIFIAPYSFCVLNGLESIDGILTSLAWFDLNKKDLQIKEFIIKYGENSGEKINYQSALIYESVFLFKDILRQKLSKGNPVAMLKGSTIELPLSGKLFFDSNAVLNRRLAFSVTQNGSIVDLNLLDRSVLKNLQEKVIQRRFKK